MTNKRHGATPGKVTPENKGDTTAKVIQLLHIAQLAIDLHKARNATVPAKDAYYAVLREFGKGKLTERLDPRNENCAEMIAYSKDAFKAYQAAKRRVYNVQRRLDNACRAVKQACAEAQNGGAA